jgi:hydrogenase expression/formation protein HypC
MCLGVPGQIIDIETVDEKIMANVDFVGEMKRVCLNYLPELAVGDYVIVHAGYALTKMTEEEADKTVKMMRDVGLLEEAVS